MVKFGVTGNERKKLVKKLEALTGARAAYQGMPTMAFVVGDYTVDKAGTVTPDPTEDIMEALSRAGFSGESEESEEQEENSLPGVTITFPMDTLTENAVDNFANMVESKSALIKEAFGLAELPIDYDDDTLKIRWFEERELSPEEKQNATAFISAMIDKAGKQKYVSAKPVATDNPKYNFRVFLNALGFVGTEHKELRKELLKRLSGSSAFRHPVQKGASA